MQLPILEQFASLADATRARALLALSRSELTVSELCAVLQLPQSTVSRHLKLLGDVGWVRSRRDGNRRLYHLPADELPPTARRLWQLARAEVVEAGGARQDLRRLESVLVRRRTRSRKFFDSTGERWDRLRDELFGRHAHLQALVGLLPHEWTVADLGCGTGQVVATLAPCVRRVVAIDDSEAMLAAARVRLAACDNVELRHGTLEALPLARGEADAATLILVLHHLPDPGHVLREVARILRPGGRALVVDMLPHDREEYRREMGHVWLGFSEDQLRRLLAGAGLRPVAFRSLPVEPAARGPELFLASCLAGAPDDRRSVE